jgi:hypothetical protein
VQPIVSPLVQRYVQAAAHWRRRGPEAEEWIRRNPNLERGAEWNPPPEGEARARLQALGLDRVPPLGELYTLHDGAQLSTLGGLRLLPLAEVFDARDMVFQPLPTPPGDTALVFSDDSEFAFGVYLSGPLVGAVFEHDVAAPEPVPGWRSLDEFLTALLALPDDDFGDEPTRTLPTTAPGDPHREADWRVAQELYTLVRNPGSREDPLPFAIQLTPYEHSDVLLEYLDEDGVASERAVRVLGRRRWAPARVRIAEVAEWPLFGVAHRHNAALAAQITLREWDAPEPGAPAR